MSFVFLFVLVSACLFWSVYVRFLFVTLFFSLCECLLEFGRVFVVCVCLCLCVFVCMPVCLCISMHVCMHVLLSMCLFEWVDMCA